MEQGQQAEIQATLGPAPTAPTNIETAQAERFQAARQAARTQAFRRLLAEIDHQNSDAQLDYHGLLRRVKTVVSKELGEPS